MAELIIVAVSLTLVAGAAVAALWASNRSKDQLVRALVKDATAMATEFKDAALCHHQGQLDRMEQETARMLGPRRVVRDDPLPRIPGPDEQPDEIVGRHSEREVEEIYT